MQKSLFKTPISTFILEKIKTFSLNVNEFIFKKVKTTVSISFFKISRLWIILHPKICRNSSNQNYECTGGGDSHSQRCRWRWESTLTTASPVLNLGPRQAQSLNCSTLDQPEQTFGSLQGIHLLVLSPSTFIFLLVGFSFYWK